MMRRTAGGQVREPGRGGERSVELVGPERLDGVASPWRLGSGGIRRSGESVELEGGRDSGEHQVGGIWRW